MRTAQQQQGQNLRQPSPTSGAWCRPAVAPACSPRMRWVLPRPTSHPAHCLPPGSRAALRPPAAAPAAVPWAAAAPWAAAEAPVIAWAAPPCMPQACCKQPPRGSACHIDRLAAHSGRERAQKRQMKRCRRAPASTAALSPTWQRRRGASLPPALPEKALQPARVMPANGCLPSRTDGRSRAHVMRCRGGNRSSARRMLAMRSFRPVRRPTLPPTRQRVAELLVPAGAGARACEALWRTACSPLAGGAAALAEAGRSQRTLGSSVRAAGLTAGRPRAHPALRRPPPAARSLATPSTQLLIAAPGCHPHPASLLHCSHTHTTMAARCRAAGLLLAAALVMTMAAQAEASKRGSPGLAVGVWACLFSLPPCAGRQRWRLAPPAGACQGEDPVAPTPEDLAAPAAAAPAPSFGDVVVDSGLVALGRRPRWGNRQGSHAGNARRIPAVLACRPPG